MKNIKISVVIFVVGASIQIYGILKAPVANESEIRSIYNCERITKEALATDEYCSSPEKAPEAQKNYENAFVYAGIGLIVTGLILVALKNSQYKLKNK